MDRSPAPASNEPAIDFGGSMMGASYPSAVKTALEILQEYDLLWIVRACARSFLTLRREFERAQEAQSARA